MIDLKKRNGKLKPISEEDLIEEFKNLPNDSEKKRFSLFKKDRREPLYNNFSEIMSAIPDPSLPRLFLLACKNEKVLSEFSNWIHENVEAFASRLNNCGEMYASTVSSILACNYEDLGTMFGGKLDVFYQALNNNGFEFLKTFDSDYMRDADGRVLQKRRNQSLNSERFELYKSFFDKGTIKPQDVYPIVGTLLADGQRDIIQNHLSNIANLTDQPISTCHILEKYKIDTKEYKQIADTRQEACLKEMLLFYRGLNFEKSKNTIEIIGMMVNELLKTQNLGYTDMYPLGQGGYSKAYKVGDKVIKMGRPPEQYDLLRNSKRFIQPLVRRQFDAQGDKLPVKISFEVTEFCNTKTKVTEEEIYQVYKDVRDQKMVWTDCTSVNVGRLIKPNIVHFQGLKGVKKAHHSSIGIEKDNDVEVLGPGELVILDLDYIFREGDPKTIIPSVSEGIFKMYEERYQREKREQGAGEPPIKEPKVKSKGYDMEI